MSKEKVPQQMPSLEDMQEAGAAMESQESIIEINREAVKDSILELIDQVVKLTKEGKGEESEEMKEVRKKMSEEIDNLLLEVKEE